MIKQKEILHKRSKNVRKKCGENVEREKERKRGRRDRDREKKGRDTGGGCLRSREMLVGHQCQILACCEFITEF